MPSTDLDRHWHPPTTFTCTLLKISQRFSLRILFYGAHSTFMSGLPSFKDLKVKETQSWKYCMSRILARVVWNTDVTRLLQVCRLKSSQQHSHWKEALLEIIPVACQSDPFFSCSDGWLFLFTILSDPISSCHLSLPATQNGTPLSILT